MKEKRRVLWYANDGLNGKIGCLGKPLDRIALNGFQESLNSVYLSSLFPLMIRSSLAAPWQKSWKVNRSENCGRLKVG